MNELDKISLIIPFYNRLELLEETIISVQNQTCSEWELILVDDCSSEDYVHLKDKYESTKIRFVKRLYELFIKFKVFRIRFTNS